MNKKNLALINRLMTAMRVAVGDELPPVDEEGEIVKKRMYIPVRDQYGRFAAGQGEWKEVEVKIHAIDAEFRRRRDCQPHYLVYWAAINEQGQIHHDTYAICHAMLTRPGVKNPKFIINRLQWGWKSGKAVAPRDTLEAYLEYLSYRSPYRKAFAIKGGKKILDDGYAVFNTNIPGNLMAAAMLSVRMMWEYPGVPFIWHELVKNGVHPDVAYLHSYQVQCKDFETLTTVGIGSHSPINGSGFSKQFATNFVKHNPVNAIDKNYNVYHVYNGMFTLFGYSKNVYYANESYLSEHLPDIGKRALQKVEKKNINPFANAGGKRDAIPAKRFCELWAPILIDNYKEILNAK
jgi:hypothetical protein